MELATNFRYVFNIEVTVQLTATYNPLLITILLYFSSFLSSCSTVYSIIKLGLGSPHLAYDRLVIDYDDQNVQTKIIDTLVNHLDTSSRGLVMGGDEYDRVGNTIWSNRNAIKAISDKIFLY